MKVKAISELGTILAITSVLTRATRRHILGDSILPSHRLENLKSYIGLTSWALWCIDNVFCVRYELSFYVPEDRILRSHRREDLILQLISYSRTWTHIAATYDHLSLKEMVQSKMKAGLMLQGNMSQNSPRVKWLEYPEYFRSTQKMNTKHRETDRLSMKLSDVAFVTI
jgi:hypothetical protein